MDQSNCIIAAQRLQLMNTVPFPLLTPMHDTVELNFLNIITDGDVAGRDYTVQKRYYADALQEESEGRRIGS